MSTKINVGILSLQGAFDLHAQVLNEISNNDGNIEIVVSQVRRPDQLAGLDGIIFPGGESTVMEKLLKSSELFEPLSKAIVGGLPTLGTCAGLILLANIFKVLDVEIARNAYGPQIDSFETDVELPIDNQTCRGFFIRAPKILKVGNGIQTLATLDNEIVGVRKDNLIGVTFHPEVAKSIQIHQIFVEVILRRLKSSDQG